MVSVEYEVACQTIGQLIARQAELIAVEESRAEPIQATLTRAISARAAPVAERDALAVDDALSVSKILTTYGPIALQLNVRKARLHTFKRMGKWDRFSLDRRSLGLSCACAFI